MFLNVHRVHPLCPSHFCKVKAGTVARCTWPGQHMFLLMYLKVYLCNCKIFFLISINLLFIGGRLVSFLKFREIGNLLIYTERLNI